MDLLPKFLPNVRVLAYGYNANVSSLKGGPTSSDRILHHAHTLVADLQADRAMEEALEEGATRRPIIFLAHSLGGIIVKKALAYSKSRTAQKIVHLHSIYICTYGILFFGTPHNGSSKARLLASLEAIVSLTIPKKILETDSSLVKALEEDSEILQEITDQFVPLMQNFHIFFFWEEKRTDLKYKKDYIVDHNSAAPILDNTERCGIAADHINMCKFERRDSPGFRTVVAALRRYAQDAPFIIGERNVTAAAMLRAQGWHNATELVGGIPEWRAQYPLEHAIGHGEDRIFQQVDSSHGYRGLDEAVQETSI